MMQKICLVPYFKQYNLKCEKNIIMCLVCVCIYIYIFIYILSSKFLTSTIILLIFIKGVHMREKGGKERE